MLKKVATRFAVVVVGLLPLLGQPVTASASTSGTLYAISGNQDVLNRYDLTAGTLTPIAQLAGANQGQTGTLTVDPIAHRIYGLRTTVIFTPPFNISITNEVLTINSVTGAFTVSKPVNAPVNQILFDPSNHSLIIDGVNGIFHVDPSTGAVTPLTNFDRLTNQGMAGMAIDPATHTLYVDVDTAQGGNFGSDILTVDSQSGALRNRVSLPTNVGFLGFDSATGALLASGRCCTSAVLERIDPVAGTITPISLVNTDPSVILGFAMAIDPASQSVYLDEQVFQPDGTAPSVILTVDEGTGETTTSQPLSDNVASLLFEPDVTVTPDTIKADVQSALASGAISKAGVANTLLDDLNAAAAARVRGNCNAAGNIYESFINDVNSQTGKAIAISTASRFVSEAQFLIANCP